MNCGCCSAPLPSEGVVCAYCGSRQDVDLRGWARYQATGAREDLHCPDGHGCLEEIRLNPPFEAVWLGRCPTCLGLFLDRGGLEQLLEQAVAAAWQVDRELLDALASHPRQGEGEGRWRYRPCPGCGDLMNRSLFGKRSRVIIDRCRDHGTWLDAGELRQLMEWSRAGGRILQRQWEEERQRTEAVEAAATAVEAAAAWWEPRHGQRFGSRFGQGADDRDAAVREDDLLRWLARGLRGLLR